jgi:proline iminopeptidase
MDFRLQFNLPKFMSNQGDDKMKSLFFIIPLLVMLCFSLACQQTEKADEGTVSNAESADKRYMPLDVPDASLAYSAEGTGIPCVVFTGGESLGTKIYSKKLKQHFRFIYADPKNLSREDAQEITLSAILADIEKVRMILGLEKIAVMGHSMYSVLPPAYALEYPGYASHLIITGGLPSISEKSDEASNEYWESEASDERKELRKRNQETLTEDVLSKLSPSETRIKNYMANIPFFFYDAEFDMSDVWEGVEINTDFSTRLWELVYGLDNMDKFHLIGAPVLVVSGRYDFWAPYYLWDDVKERFPDITYILFDHAGHNPMLEIPEEFDRKLIDWVKSH